MSNLRLTVVLAMTAALGSFAFDTYLPAFPSIAQSLQTNIGSVALSVSLYMFGLAFGQLIGGPLSDRYGRAKIMFVGLFLFAVASLLLSFSTNITELLLFRALQAFGGGWSAVSVPAIVRDRTEAPESAKLFSLIALMAIIAPAIAPSIGSLLLMIVNWRGIFIFLTLYALIVSICAKHYLFPPTRSLQPCPPSSKPKLSFFKSYALVLKNKTAVYFILLQSFALSILMTFLSNASFIYQQWFGVSNFTFAIFFACNIIMMASMSITNRILLRWWQPERILCLAISLQAVAVLALVIIVVWQQPLHIFVPALMIAVGSMGMISPNNQACCLYFFKENSATAAALLGAAQLTIAGCISGLSVLLGRGTLHHIVVMMSLCALACIILVSRAYNLMRQTTTSPQLLPVPS